MTYTVKQGDTLSKIAKAYGLTVDKLLELNPQYKANPDKIKVGDTLNIPDNQSQPEGQSSLKQRGNI